MKDRSTLVWILRRIGRRIPMLLLMTLVEAVGAVLGVLFALAMRNVIDCATTGDVGRFVGACVVQVALILGVLGCSLLSRWMRDKLAHELDRDWKKRLVHALLRGEYAAVSAYHSGELINRLNNDVRTVDEGVLLVLPGVLSTLVRLVAALTVLAAMEPTFAGLLVVLGLLMILVTGVLRRGLKRLHKQVSQAEGQVMSFHQEAMEKLLAVQAMDLSGEVERRSDVLLEERYQAQRRKRRVSLLANTGVSVLYYTAGFSALCWCGWGLLMGRMSFGTLSAVMQLVTQLQTPFVNLSGFLPRYTAMLASAERLMELDSLPTQAQAQEMDAGAFEQLVGDQITFAYGEEPVLREACFHIPEGAFAVICGASGIGKSTLLKLLLGIYPPADGQLYARMAGEKVPLSGETRRLFAYVPQGNFLFSGTLRENLLIAAPDATPTQLEQAIHVSAMEQFLPQLPDGLDTVIGERGEGLSEGQAQRLAIARAVLSCAPVLLLDEATSALDVDTERTVLQRLSLLPGRTCIAVTHRPAATELADVRLEVADGKIQTIGLI